MSATYLSKAVQILVRAKYAADCNTGASPEDKISRLASSVSRLSKQVRPLAPNDALYSAFTSGSVAAAQDVFLSIFGLTMPSCIMPGAERRALRFPRLTVDGFPFSVPNPSFSFRPQALVARTNGAPAAHGACSTDSERPPFRRTAKRAPRRMRDRGAIDRRLAACSRSNARRR
jgi:hypothetical protein